MIYRLIIFTILFASNAAVGQSKKFSIIGRIEGLANGRIALLYPNADTAFKVDQDTVKISNGQFEFTGVTPYTFAAYLFSIDSSVRTSLFFIDPGVQLVDVNIDSFNTRPKSNSISNKEYTTLYLPLYDSVQKKIVELNATLREANKKNNDKNSSSLIDSLEKVRVNYRQIKDSILYHYIRQNPNSYSVFWDLFFVFRFRGYTASYENAYSLFSPSLRITTSGKRFQEDINKSRRVDVGAMFPLFQAIDLWNSKTELSGKLISKYTFVDFWFHNCIPCINQFDFLKKVSSEFNPNYFSVIGISVDKKADGVKLKSTLKKYNIQWPQLWDINGVSSANLLINVFPTNFLLNNDGKILLKNVEPEALERYLTEHSK